jgi:hypothetical protein
MSTRDPEPVRARLLDKLEQRLVSTGRRDPLSGLGGQRALEGSPVVRPAVRCEYELDRQLEQRAQPLGDLLVSHAGQSHLSLISRPRPKSTSVSPEITARWLSTQSTVVVRFMPGTPCSEKREGRGRARGSRPMMLSRSR